MSSPFEISVVVSTYQRPGHLKRCLQSLAAQQGVDGKYEVIVVDDGSQDETAEMVARFARNAAFPVRFVTHPHEGFQLARCRNAGIRIASAPYILFTDGDCIFPANHLQRHLAARRPGIARAGDCIKLDQAASERIDESAIRSGAFLKRVSLKQRLTLRRLHAKLLAYQMLHRDKRVKLTGWNMGVWREDLERVNGFDERFRGWGCEDDDLASRLRRSGVRIATALGYTHGFHLWHRVHSTTPQQWSAGPNVAYFRRPAVLARCLEGIRSRSLQHVSTRVTGGERHAELARQLSHSLRESTTGVEVEVLLWTDGPVKFTSGAGACRVLVAAADAVLPEAVQRGGHAVLRADLQQGAPAIIQGLHGLLCGTEPAAAPARLAA